MKPSCFSSSTLLCSREFCHDSSLISKGVFFFSKVCVHKLYLLYVHKQNSIIFLSTLPFVYSFIRNVRQGGNLIVLEVLCQEKFLILSNYYLFKFNPLSEYVSIFSNKGLDDCRVTTHRSLASFFFYFVLCFLSLF
jgi:hypothetical protein